MAEFKHLVRIANTDLKGEKAVAIALKNIKGIGIPLSHAVCTLAGIDSYAKLGNLSDADIKKLDQIIQTLEKQGLPHWMLNRRKDLESGEDKHIITNDLIFNLQNDIKLMRRTKSYKGQRHGYGLPVRGQRTRSNFRKNKGKVTGVKTSGKKK